MGDEITMGEQNPPKSSSKVPESVKSRIKIAGLGEGEAFISHSIPSTKNLFYPCEIWSRLSLHEFSDIIHEW